MIADMQHQMLSIAPNIPVEHRHHPQGLEAYRMENGYFKLAAHFKWALNQVCQ
jgi:hypothetical protein